MDRFEDAGSSGPNSRAIQTLDRAAGGQNDISHSTTRLKAVNSADSLFYSSRI